MAPAANTVNSTGDDCHESRFCFSLPRLQRFVSAAIVVLAGTLLIASSAVAQPLPTIRRLLHAV